LKVIVVILLIFYAYSQPNATNNTNGMNGTANNTNATNNLTNAAAQINFAPPPNITSNTAGSFNTTGAKFYTSKRL
jgi:hypothetical protein